MGLSNVRSPLHAEVVKLVDTLASGASARKGVEVQVLSSAPFKPTFCSNRLKPTFQSICLTAQTVFRVASGLGLRGAPYRKLVGSRERQNLSIKI